MGLDAGAGRVVLMASRRQDIPCHYLTGAAALCGAVRRCAREARFE